MTNADRRRGRDPGEASHPTPGGVALGLAVVALANAVYLAGLERVLDPMMSMEPFYIHLARAPWLEIARTDAAWGPLYAFWLKPFVLLLDDPLRVYGANLRALSLGVSLGIYVHVLVLTRRVAVAVGTALLFLVGDFNVPLYSKIGGFALMVALAGLSAAQFVRRGAPRLAVAAATALVAAYARPELYPAALLLWAFSAREACQAGGPDRRAALAWPAAGLALILIGAILVGVPLFGREGGTDRALVAFREHFAWNWSRWHGRWQSFGAVWEQEFGGALSLSQALRNNPQAVARHIADNFLGTLKFLAFSLCSHYPVLVPAAWQRLARLESALVSLGVLGLVLAAVSRRELRTLLYERHRDTLIAYAFLGAVGVASAVAIYPLAGYLVFASVLLMTAAALAAAMFLPCGPNLGGGGRTIAVAACLAAVPRPFVLPSAYVVAGSNFKGRIAVTRTVTDTVGFVRSLGLPSPVRVLTVSDGVGEFLGPGFAEIKAWQKGSRRLEDYMRENDVGMVVRLEPGRDSFALSDPYWQVIQIAPESVGFTALTVPGHDYVGLFVRNDLLAARRPVSPQHRIGEDP